MLPQLNKKKSIEVDASNTNSQPALDFNERNKQSKTNVKSVSAKKVRTGGGFMKTNILSEPENKPLISSQKYGTHQNSQKFAKIRRTQDLARQIKLIEKKIKACQKKIEQDRKKQKLIAEQMTRDNQKPQYNFDSVIQRQLKLQGYQQPGQNNKNFDYLTNPRLNPAEQQQETNQIPQKPLIVQQNPFDLKGNIQKMQRFYENSLKKKFQRRQMFPHQACRRKTPKLFITQKNNALKKHGKAQNETQHLFRILTKQTTPQQIYPTIPNFAVVKDNLSRNIVAYLGDYKPFLDKTKQGIQKQNKEEEKNSDDDTAQNKEQGLQIVQKINIS